MVTDGVVDIGLSSPTRPMEEETLSRSRCDCLNNGVECCKLGGIESGYALLSQSSLLCWIIVSLLQDKMVPQLLIPILLRSRHRGIVCQTLAFGHQYPLNEASEISNSD
jgi:hypothetical protein